MTRWQKIAENRLRLWENSVKENKALKQKNAQLRAALEEFDSVMTEFGEKGVYSPSPINEAWRIAIEALAAGGE